MKKQKNLSTHAVDAIVDRIIRQEGGKSALRFVRRHGGGAKYPAAAGRAFRAMKALEEKIAQEAHAS